MLLSAVSVLVVAQSSSEIPEGLMNNSVYSCRQRNAGKVQNLKINNRFKNLTKVRYLGRTVTNLNFMHDEVKIRLKSLNTY